MNTFAIIVIVLNVILAIVFLMRSRIVSLMSYTLKAAFFIFMFISISTILLPAPYEIFSDLILKQMGVHDSIVQLDEGFILNDISSAQSEFTEGFNNLFGGDSDGDTESESTSFFEDNIYPTFVSILAMLLRIFLGIISLLATVGIIYLSFATSGVSESADLRNRYYELEARIASLESGN